MFRGEVLVVRLICRSHQNYALSNDCSLSPITPPSAMIPPVRTDPVWGRAQSGPVPPEGRTGLGPRLAVLDWTGLVWTDPFTHIILSLLFSQVLPKT